VYARVMLNFIEMKMEKSSIRRIYGKKLGSKQILSISGLGKNKSDSCRF
jgi:hypothetical protein